MYTKIKKISIALMYMAFVFSSQQENLVAVPDPKEKNICKNKKFSIVFFANHINDWSKYKKYFEGKPNMRGLEIGSFEGGSTLWFAKNYFNGAGSTLEAIDVWDNGPYEKLHTDRLGSKGASSLYEAFLFNLKEEIASGHVIPIRARSKEALLKFNYEVLKGTRALYDFIYIDGAHDAKSVIEDTVLAWGLLKEGGILIFDDYRMPGGGPSTSHELPKSAIDLFMHAYVGKYDVLHNSYQLHIKKNSFVKELINTGYSPSDYVLHLLPPQAGVSLADQATISVENILPGSKWRSTDSAIDGMRVYRSHHLKDDVEDGIAISLRKGDRLFYKSGSIGGQQFVEIPESGKPALALPVSPEWVQLDFSSIALPFGDFTVVLKDKGKSENEWSAIAVLK